MNNELKQVAIAVGGVYVDAGDRITRNASLAHLVENAVMRELVRVLKFPKFNKPIHDVMFGRVDFRHNSVDGHISIGLANGYEFFGKAIVDIVMDASGASILGTDNYDGALLSKSGITTVDKFNKVVGKAYAIVYKNAKKSK